MADAPKANPYNLIAIVGISDMVLGVGLAVAGLTGMAGDGVVLPIVGGVMALAGGGIFVWAREKSAAHESGQ